MTEEQKEPCKHLRTQPEQFRGGFSPNADGDYHSMGQVDGERCLDCGLWQVTKRAV